MAAAIAGIVTTGEFSMANKKEEYLGFIGAGKMATALACGVVKSGAWPADRVLATDISADSLKNFVAKAGAAASLTAVDLVEKCAVIVLAVKPGHVAQALAPLSRLATPRLLISIAAGVTLARLESLVPAAVRVIRVMPNTPALVGAGASAYSLGARATEQDALIAQRILGSVGLAVQVAEAQLDAVTGLSGSGPAYLCVVIEALADGGVAAGLPRPLALQLAAQTVLGSGRLVVESGEHPARLKDDVASPAGTTVEGLKILEARGVRSAFIEAVGAATRRSRELGQSFLS